MSVKPKIPLRQTDRETHQVGSFDDEISRYYDNIAEYTVVKLFTGDCYVTDEPREMLVTILGSCVAVCARDPVAGVGGMNHILLPGEGKVDVHSAMRSTRYGANAMEELINGILKKGGHKSRLEVKIFGGGKIMDKVTMIGDRNIEFVREYLENENLRIAAQDVGGEYPRRVHYFPQTGKVKMRRLRRQEDRHIVKQEKRYAQSSWPQRNQEAEIELFS